MATEIKMPKLGESVTEGTIGKWLKRPGERVEKYEALLEVTTDKVDTEVPAPESGILREIAVPEGTTVRVGTLLAVLENDGDRTENQERAPAGSTSANGSENLELKARPLSPSLRSRVNSAKGQNSALGRRFPSHTAAQFRQWSRGWRPSTSWISGRSKVLARVGASPSRMFSSILSCARPSRRLRPTPRPAARL